MKFKQTAILLLAVILLQSGCGLFKDPKKDVEKAYQQFITSIVDKNWPQTWNSMAYESQKQYDDFVFKPFKTVLLRVPAEKKRIKLDKLNVTTEQIENMSPPDFFSLQMTHTPLRDEILKIIAPERTIESIEVNGSEAVITMKEDKKTIHMKLEDSQWRIVVFKPGKLIQ